MGFFGVVMDLDQGPAVHGMPVALANLAFLGLVGDCFVAGVVGYVVFGGIAPREVTDAHLVCRVRPHKARICSDHAGEEGSLTFTSFVTEIDDTPVWSVCLSSQYQIKAVL